MWERACDICQSHKVDTVCPCFLMKKEKNRADLPISNNSILFPLVFHGAAERGKHIKWNNFIFTSCNCARVRRLWLSQSSPSDFWWWNVKITQGAVYPLASLSIPLSWIIPEYCGHFSPLLLCCQVALTAFLTKFQGGGLCFFRITQVQKQRAIISIFIFLCTKSHTGI